MEQPYLRARLQKHGLTVLVPESTAVIDEVKNAEHIRIPVLYKSLLLTPSVNQIFRYIRDEFSADVFSDEARAYFR